MSSWSKDELRKIAETDDLHISPFREDGVTCGTPTWIRSVVVDGNQYVRAYNGTNSSWYQAATEQKAGRIAAGGLTKEVAFETAEGQIDNCIDDAYRAKYQSSPYLKPMISINDHIQRWRAIVLVSESPSRCERAFSSSQPGVS
jgi:hypothetical protein